MLKFKPNYVNKNFLWFKQLSYTKMIPVTWTWYSKLVSPEQRAH